MKNRETMIGSHINNAYLLREEKILLLKIRGPEGSVRLLLLQPSIRAHFTSRKLEFLQEKTEGLAHIRRLIRDKRIVEVRQVGFDRILEIALHDGYKIIVELLPRGEAIIIDEKGTVRYATAYKKMRDREITYGRPYVYPPLIESTPTLEECERGEELLRKLPREVILEAQNREGRLCDNLEKIYAESFDLGRGYLAYRGESPEFFSPYRPTFLERLGLRVEELNTFNEAVDAFYSRLTAERLAYVRTKRAMEAIEKLKKTIEKERAKSLEFLEKSNEAKQLADFLMAHKEAAESILECVKNTIKTLGWESVISECHGVLSTDPAGGIVLVSLEGKEVSINVKESIKEQINRHYDEYKRLKEKYQRAMETLKELERRIEEQALALEREKSETMLGIRRAYWYERYIWSFTRNNLLIIAGRDAQQNESIVRKYLKDKDWFFHADIQGAPATILFSGEQPTLTEEDAYDASVLAACFSKAWKAGLASVDVFYVRGEQVSKSPPAGEYLPKGSFMIYGKKNYVRNVPLELAFGVEHTEDGSFRFTVGSKESVGRRGDLLGYLSPGDSHPSKVAERVRKRLRQMGYSYVPNRQEIESLVPGPSKIKFIV